MGVLRIPSSNAIPDIGLSANKLANVSDVSEDVQVHTYIPTVGADLALKRLCFWWARPPTPYKGPPKYWVSFGQKSGPKYMTKMGF